MPAIKEITGKLPWDLLPWSALEEVVKVYAEGANKYAPDNWKADGGVPYSQCFAALMRHATEWWRGENFNDRDFGLHHMAHAAFWCLAIIYYHQAGTGKDDRPEEV